MAKRGLGRGLDVLLPDIMSNDGIEQISLDLLDPLVNQPRQIFNDDSLSELADSIKNDGVISPLIVVKNKSRYSIVAGERRFRASRLAKLDTVPCIVKNLDEEQIYKISLIENIQREDLNPLDEAEAYQRLIDRFHYTQEQLADGLGKSRSTIANCLRLNKLCDYVKIQIRNNNISLGHAKVLAGIDNVLMQEKLCKSVVDNSLSVRQLESIVKKSNKPLSSSIQHKDAELMAFQRDIKSKYGIQMSINGTTQKGKIILKYSNESELNTIYNLLNSK